MQQLILNKIGPCTSVYVLEDNVLCEMYEENLNKKSTLGNIYRGRVEDIVNGMQAAFIDIGLEKKAFISTKDAMKKVDVTKEKLDVTTKMSDVLKQKQSIMVQVKKEPTGEKGARVSTHITFPGKYVVLMPETDIITVSQKIENEEEIQRLKNIAKRILKGKFGIIIRTDAEGLEDKIIEKDIENVISAWNNIKLKMNAGNEIDVLYDDNSIVNKALRDIANKTTERIFVNTKEIYDEVVEKLPDIECRFYENVDLIDQLGLETEISKAKERKVWLKHGGQIVIDKTEALTAIDVNSSKYTGSKDLESTTLSVNLEAAIEVMKQIRLKDIGGIIVVDFIDMKDKEHQSQILKLMRNEAKKDRSKVDIREFTELNLVELTRKKMYI